MKNKRFIEFFIVTATLLLSACSGTRNLSNNSNGELSPIDTFEPTKTPEPTNTPEPTATNTSTPTPLPNPVSINLANIGSMQLTHLTEVESKALGAPEDAWGIGQFTWDGNQLVVKTQFGVDILDATTLELLDSFHGYTPIQILEDNIIVVRQDTELYKLDSYTGEFTNLFTFPIATNTIAVSQNGNRIAYVTGNNTFDVFFIDTQTTEPYTFQRPIAVYEIIDLAFRSDGKSLFVTGNAGNVNLNDMVSTVFDLGDNEATYGYQHFDLFVDSPPSPLYWDEEVNGGWFLFPNAYTGGSQLALAYTKADYSDIVYIRIISRTYGGENVDAGVCSNMKSQIMQPVGRDSIDDVAVLYTGIKNNCSTQRTTVKYLGPAYNFGIWNNVENADLGSIVNISSFGTDSHPYTFGFNPEGTNFFTISWDGVFRLWEVTGKNDANLLSESASYALPIPMDLSQDGTQLAIGKSTSVEILDSKTGELIQTVELPNVPDFGSPSRVRDVVGLIPNFLEGERLGLRVLLSTERINSLFHFYDYEDAYIWNLTSNELTDALIFTDLQQCEFTDSGLTALCYKQRYPVSNKQVYNTAEGGLILSVKEDNVDYGALSNDGQFFSSCRATNSYISVTNLINSSVFSVSIPCQENVFTPDGTGLLTLDGTLIDIVNNEIIVNLETPNAYTDFQEVFFSPNQDFIIVNHDIYDLNTGTLITTIPGEETIHGISFSEDELTITVLTDKGVAFWQVLE